MCCDWQVWPYRAAAKPSQPKNRLRLFAASPGFKSSRGGSSTWKIYVTEIFGVGLLLGRTMAQPRTSILATGCHPAMGPRQAGRRGHPSHCCCSVPNAHPALGQGTQAREGGAAKPVKHIKEEQGGKANGSLIFQSSCKLVKTGNSFLPPVMVYMDLFYIR